MHLQAFAARRMWQPLLLLTGYACLQSECPVYIVNTASLFVLLLVC
jgi:hypothetical protein